MSAILVLWLMCGFLANLPSASSQTPTYPPFTTPPLSSGCGNASYYDLVSPGYPHNYPKSMDCDYWVYIPYSKALQIYFQYFQVDDCGKVRAHHDVDSGTRCHGSCVYFKEEMKTSCLPWWKLQPKQNANHDYLKISNEQNQTFGYFCGNQNGHSVTVTGQYAVFTYHSDGLQSASYKLLFSYVSQGCGYASNYELVSPGYPNNYPNNMDCNYFVYIPYFKALQIYFEHFQVNNCGYDYLKISNEQNKTFGSFCGNKNGHSVIVTGRYAVLTFHSDGIINDKGYRLFFSYVAEGVSTSWPPYTNYPTYPTYPTYKTPSKPYPSYYPSMGPKCKLQTYIHILEIVLNEMDNVVKYELGSKYSAREYKVRVKRALSNVQMARSKAGRQKRDVREVRKIDKLEQRAAELMKRLDTKEAQSQMRDSQNRKMAEVRAERAPMEAD